MASEFETLTSVPMSDVLAASLARAAEYARAVAAPEVTSEHLLMSLTDDPDASEILSASQIDIYRVQQDMAAVMYEASQNPAQPPSGGLGISQDLRRILEAASAAASGGRRRDIDGAIVLAAIIGDERTIAAARLKDQGLTFEAAIKALQNLLSQSASARQRPTPLTAGQPERAEDVLAGARERVQSRAAPGLPELPRPAMPAAAVMMPAAAVSTPAPQPAPAGTDQNFAAAPQHQPIDTPVQPEPTPYAPGPASGLAAGLAARPAAPPPMPPPLPPAGQRAVAPQARHEPSFTNGAWPAAPHGPAPVPAASPPVQAPAPAAPPLAMAAPQPAPRRPQQPQRRGPKSFDLTQFLEPIPRLMRASVASPVEIRIPKSELDTIAGSIGATMQGGHEQQPILRALTVRMRAPDGRFQIEPQSPDTQWIENRLDLMSDDYASWRWHITPRRRGSGTIEVIVSARNISADGSVTETGILDQPVAVKAKINGGQAVLRFAGLATAAAVGWAMARLEAPLLAVAQSVISKFSGG